MLIFVLFSTSVHGQRFFSNSSRFHHQVTRVDFETRWLGPFIETPWLWLWPGGKLEWWPAGNDEWIEDGAFLSAGIFAHPNSDLMFVRNHPLSQAAHSGQFALSTRHDLYDIMVSLGKKTDGTNSVRGYVQEIGLWIAAQPELPFGRSRNTGVNFFDVSGVFIATAAVTNTFQFVGFRYPRGISALRVNDNSGHPLIDALRFTRMRFTTNSVLTLRDLKFP